MPGLTPGWALCRSDGADVGPSPIDRVYLASASFRRRFIEIGRTLGSPLMMRMNLNQATLRFVLGGAQEPDALDCGDLRLWRPLRRRDVPGDWRASGPRPCGRRQAEAAPAMRKPRPHARRPFPTGRSAGRTWAQPAYSEARSLSVADSMQLRCRTRKCRMGDRLRSRGLLGLSP